MNSVAKSLITRGATFPVTAVATFITTAVIINATDSFTYGLIMLIASVFTLIPYADLGMGAVVVNALSEKGISHDTRISMVGSVFRWLVISGGVVILLSLGGIKFWSWSELLGIKGFSAADADLSTSIAIMIFGVSVPFSIGPRILVGLGRNDIALLISATTSIFTLSITFAMTQMNISPIYIGTSVPSGILLSQILGFIVATRYLGVNLRLLVTAAIYPWFKLISTAAPMLLILIFLPLALNTHRIILSHNSTLFELSKYTLAMQFYSPLWSFVVAAAASLWPIFASQRHDPATSSSSVKRSIVYLGLGGLVAILGLVSFGGWAGRVVSGGNIDLPVSLLLVTGLLLLAQSLQQVPGMYLTTAKGLLFQSVCVGCMAVLSISGSWVLVPHLGAIAPALVTAVAVLLCQFIPGLIYINRKSVIVD